MDTGTPVEDRDATTAPWRRRVAVLAPTGAGGVLAVVPAFAAGVVVAAVVVAGAAAVGLATPDDPLAELPTPIVVDADPALPTDEEPDTGWPAGSQVPGGEGTDPTGVVDADDTAAVDADVPDVPAAQVTEEATDALEDVTGTLDETLDDAQETLDDALDDTTDVVDDVIGDAVDDAAETVDDATGTLAP